MPINDFAIVPPISPAMRSEKPISAYILRVMEEEGWSQADVLKNAKALKIHLRQATLSEILTGETADPRIFTLIDICRALHRPFDEMVSALEGTTVANSVAFTQSDFALMFRMYERLNVNGKRLVDHFIDMLKTKLVELLKQQGETNLYQLRK